MRGRSGAVPRAITAAGASRSEASPLEFAEEGLLGALEGEGGGARLGSGGRGGGPGGGSGGRAGEVRLGEEDEERREVGLAGRVQGKEREENVQVSVGAS